MKIRFKSKIPKGTKLMKLDPIKCEDTELKKVFTKIVQRAYMVQADSIYGVEVEVNGILMIVKGGTKTYSAICAYHRLVETEAHRLKGGRRKKHIKEYRRHRRPMVKSNKE